MKRTLSQANSVYLHRLIKKYNTSVIKYITQVPLFFYINSFMKLSSHKQDSYVLREHIMQCSDQKFHTA